MTVHISARIAWHMDGWNGCVCKDPRSNTYCVGNYSYPGTLIREKRDLPWEEEVAGRPCASIEGGPPCIYSINAFGPDGLIAYADPPEFFKDGSRKNWDLPPSTVCVWPYEEMYRDEVSPKGRFDYDERLKFAKEYFDRIERNKSLIFYYSNYSNPFSEEDQPRYVLVGLSRVKKLGDFQFYPETSEDTRRRYGGGFVWQRNVSSHYPDQGLRLPYHVYLDRQEVLDQILFVPENPRNFKYATRQFTDDDALDLVERFLEIAGTLTELGDTSENWAVRIKWLQSLVAELWEQRGLYPGMPHVLQHLGFEKAIPFFKAELLEGRESEVKDALFAFLEGGEPPKGLDLTSEEAKQLRRRWQLKTDDERELLSDVLLRFDIRNDQIDRVVGDDRASAGISASLATMTENPYTITEQFQGDGPDDTISFNKIDHGVFPSPELGGKQLMELDDWRRLRGLCVDRLKKEDKDVFVAAAQVIHDINHRLSFLPEWKRQQFNERYLSVDREDLEQAITMREEGDRLWLYLNEVFEDERLLEREIRGLSGRPDIEIKRPVTLENWRDYLHDAQSPLAERVPAEYEEAISSQAEACAHVFRRPICVLSGAAGTGKTTVIRAILAAIEKVDGAGTSFQLLAPTGKAAERLRDVTGRRGETSTVHAFLAKHGWYNKNFTFRRSGGQREDGISTYVIDESSMLSLELLAALFRSINFKTVKRFIFVGDSNQLPPIGRGRVFADVIDWLAEHSEGSVALLERNIRQMENLVLGRGIGILDVASAYRRAALQEEKSESADSSAEDALRRVQEGGDIDKDLRVLYWNGPAELQTLLIEQIISDMETDTGKSLDEQRPFELWNEAFTQDGRKRPDYQQVISPYRGEEFGTENLNRVLQESARGRKIDDISHIQGIGLFDKVIQIKNRPPSNRIWAYNAETRKPEPIEIYNGDLGFTKPHPFDKQQWKWSGHRLERLQAIFSGKEQYWVGYGSGLGKTDKGKWLKAEKVEENLELAYAISVHKAQGSEFERVYLVVPKHKRALLSRELFYTGLTRATRHCTLLIEEDISPLLSMRRPEQSHLLRVNASLFTFRPVPDELRRLGDWYEEGKIYTTLTEYMVRSKSEVIIANMLFEREIPFRYEAPLFAPDGTFYLPDFTITWQGEKWYWEHLGRLDEEKYRNHWETKHAWYEKHFPGRLLETREGPDISTQAAEVLTVLTG